MEISTLVHILFSIMLFVIENHNKAANLSSQFFFKKKKFIL